MRSLFCRYQTFVSDVLLRILPLPIHSQAISDDDEDFQQPGSSTSTQLITRVPAPPYGQRQNWKPSTPEDFGECLPLSSMNTRSNSGSGDGGAYPECHVAQYPLEMGRKKASTATHFPTSSTS